MSRPARSIVAESLRAPRDVRLTLDPIADEILARLENVLAHTGDPAGATVIIAGDSPLGSARDAHGLSTRIVQASRVPPTRRV